MTQKISKSAKFRIYPTKKQKEYIEKSFKTSRFVYNYFLYRQIDISYIINQYGLTDEALDIIKLRVSNNISLLRKHYSILEKIDPEKRKEFYIKNKLYYDYAASSREITKLSKTEKYSFLSEVHSTLSTYPIKNLKIAFENIHKTNAGFPKPKNKFSHKSYTVQPNSFNYKLINNNWIKLLIPSPKISKIGYIKMRLHNQDFLDNLNFFNILRYTISCENDKYFLSINYSFDIDEIKLPEINFDKTIGIDLGVNRIITTSLDSDFSKNDVYNDIKKSIFNINDEINRVNQILNKKRLNNKKWKKSNKYKRVLRKYNKLISKRTRQLKYLRHLISSDLMKDFRYTTIILEDFKVNKLVKNKQNSKETNKNKQNFNRNLINIGINELITQIKYKSKWSGKNVIKVNPAYTSQKCSKCGYIDKNNRKTQKKFVCLSCGYTSNADFNAANNVKQKYFENKPEFILNL